MAGKHLEFGGDERRPADQLLRWHFRQTVLANTKGVGEPHFFKFDFLPAWYGQGGSSESIRHQLEMCTHLYIICRLRIEAPA